jgi:trimeric autotransporter adhesin
MIVRLTLIFLITSLVDAENVHLLLKQQTSKSSSVPIAIIESSIKLVDLRVKRQDDRYNGGIDVNYSVSSDDELNSTNESTRLTTGFYTHSRRDTKKDHPRGSSTIQTIKTNTTLSHSKIISTIKNIATSKQLKTSNLAKSSRKPDKERSTTKSFSCTVSSASLNATTSKVMSQIPHKKVVKESSSSVNKSTSSGSVFSAKATLSFSSASPTSRGKIFESSNINNSNSFPTPKTSSLSTKMMNSVKSLGSTTSDSFTSSAVKVFASLKFFETSSVLGSPSSSAPMRSESTTSTSYEIISNKKMANQSGVKKAQRRVNAAHAQERSQKFQFDTTTISTQKIGASIFFPSK